MTTTLPLAHLTRGAALVALLGGLTACAPASSTPQASAASPQALPSSPVLLSCPAGQQPLLRQVVVNGAAVPQVECVLAPTAPQAFAPTAAAAVPAPVATPLQAAAAPMPVYAPAPAPAPVSAVPVSARPSSRPAARRAVYASDDYDELQVKKRRSWKKSAVIIGSSAGVGAGIGAATGGKKGALIGAAIGGGAATVWDQVTRR